MKLIVRHHQTILSQQKHQLSSLLSNAPQPKLLPLQMAEAVLFCIAKGVLTSVASEIAKPGGAYASRILQLLCCAEGELHSLRETVQTIQTGLLDAEKQQWHNDGVKLWLKRLKDALYDAQDLFDDISTEDLRRQAMAGNKMMNEVRLFFSESNQLVHGFNVAIKIRLLRKKLELIESANKFKFEPRPNEEIMAIGKGKKPQFHAPDTEIIGREEDKEKIKELLFDSSSSDTVSFVSILGKGGLGKTALARLAYNDVEVEGHFGLKMWVCVSDVFDVDLIIKEILKSAKGNCRGNDDEMKELLKDVENKPIDQMRSLLREVLGRKKFLLVLDDLWNEVRLKWLELGVWLRGGVGGSKILVTTRSQRVVEATDANSPIFNLKELSDDKSWDLFREVALGDRQASVEGELEKIGRDMVAKCSGIPLAIRTIGSLLYGRKEDEWRGFKERELPELPGIDAVDNGIMQVLKFSYDRLLSCLKHCFAYCSLFPKDYVYHKEMVIRLWVAQGFIESLHGEDFLEEVAEEYLLELLCKSFLDAETKGDDGEVLTFKMHDLMHDLAQEVAKGECKINFNEGIGIRHASFTSNIFSQEEMPDTSQLRTLLFLGGGDGKESSSLDYEKIFCGFSRCRVLGLGKLNIPLPPSLGSRLKHLRFLDVSGNESIKTLPDSITNLVNLQTLKLSGCKSLIALPRDLKKLINLRHLLIDGCHSLSHMPCGLNHLSSLQTLSKFVVQKMDQTVPGCAGIMDDLGGLNKLAGFIRLDNLEFLQPAPNKGHLREKEHLRSLDLRWWVPSLEERVEKSESDESIVWENLRPHQNLTRLCIRGFMGRNPPSWLSSIRCLVTLTLYVCRRWKYLPPLSELPSLRELHLWELDELEFVEEIRDPQQSNNARPFFPSLEILRLEGCGKLKGWWGRRLPVGEGQDHERYDSQSSFPKLLDLHIRECHDLKSLPLLLSVLHLVFDRPSWKVLKQQVMAVRNYSSEAAPVSTSTALSKLKKLYFQDILDLDHSMLETLLPLLRNLESMSFFRCFALRSLSSGMQHLSSLQHLQIGSCEELDLWSHDDEHGTQWRSLVNLRTLKIRGLPKLTALPEGMQHVTTLQYLSIKRCENLTSLPEWISNFSSLEDLEIIRCPGIECLPDGMHDLTSLKSFRIAACPALESRCQTEDGADWEKIKGLAPLSFQRRPWV